MLYKISTTYIDELTGFKSKKKKKVPPCNSLLLNF